MFQSKWSSLSVFSSFSLGLGLFVLTLFWLASGPAVLATAAATTWYVNAASGSDSANCLTPATACATIGASVNKAANGDTIEIAAGVYNEHDIQISKQLTLHGAGAETTIIDAGGAGRVFNTGSSVVISSLRMQNGQTSSGSIFDESGGAVLSGGSLTLRDTVIIDNQAVNSGGAIFNYGNLVLENSQVLSNTANGGSGGGIYNHNQGVITITESTLAHNVSSGAGAGGGGIYTGGRALTVRASTLADNRANYFGGGMDISTSGWVLLEGVTFSGNQAVGGGGFFSTQGTITGTNITLSGNIGTNNYGGIYISGPSVRLFLQNSTIAYNSRTNTAGNGFNGLMTGDSASASLVNTILAYNQQNNCSSFSPPTSLGHNLSDDFNCGLTQSGDQPGVDPLLAALADHGGAVQTHALLVGSPAIDAGDNALCPALDARGISRPFDGDGNAVAVCDIGAVEARRQLAIADHTVIEGNGLAVTAVFTVTLSPASASVVEVDYTTLDGSATGGLDYTPASGTLIFDPGETEKTILVSVTGDLLDELDETFTVQLSSALNADLLDAVATGTIVDTDGLPTLSIADASRLEGNTGTANLQFVVTLSPSSATVVAVTYATANGSATAGSDYSAQNGTLTFQPGETRKTISVSITGDVVDEGLSENFTVQLSAPPNATLADGEAAGTITDDDEARLTQNFGPQVFEGDSGFTPAVFTVTLSTAADFIIQVDFAVSSGFGNDGAKAGEDFVPVSGTLTFQPGETKKTYTVQVIGDTVGEGDEVYSSLISNANVPISANGSFGKILNDDARSIYLPLLLK